MGDVVHRRFELPDRSYQAIVRSDIRKLAIQAGFEGHRLGEVEIVIAEITSNLIKHASKGGYILARMLEEEERGLELIAIDNGPGMKVAAAMLEDGRSTKNTLGQGLGAIRRLSDEFDIYSLIGWGTVLFTRIYANRKYTSPPSDFFAEVIAVCKGSEQVSGDGWKIATTGKKLRLAMIDGLGHGPAAHIAAQEAIRTLTLAPKVSPVEQLRFLHENLRKTRGAVICIVHLDLVNRQIMYSGVGNISMRVISLSKAQGCFSYNGIIGHIMPAVLKDHALQWNDKTDTIVLHSDGLTSRWDIQKYAGILSHRPIMLCAALYKDFNRGNDDTTLLVGRFIK